MADFRPGTPAQAAFLGELVGEGLLLETGLPGVYGYDDDFERIRLGFSGLVARVAEPDDAESMRFPPLLPRRQLELNGYLKSFPHLAGTVFAFDGDEPQAAEQFERASRHEDWSESQSMTDLVLVPAACYPIYPAIGARGPLPPGGVAVDVGGAYVFRREPSGDPARLQMFHQQEMVRIGEPETVRAWRDSWRDRSVSLFAGIGLEVASDVAADPFFGRSGRLLAASQREQALKFELSFPITESDQTAVASFNYHEDHFTSIYGIEMEDGGVAHTACLGFGQERVVLALLSTHGLDPDGWPAEVREELRLS